MSDDVSSNDINNISSDMSIRLKSNVQSNKNINNNQAKINFEELTKCNICFNTYTSKDYPCIIKCGHMFGYKCFNEYITKNGNVKECIICRTKFKNIILFTTMGSWLDIENEISKEIESEKLIKKLLKEEEKNKENLKKYEKELIQSEIQRKEISEEEFMEQQKLLFNKLSKS